MLIVVVLLLLCVALLAIPVTLIFKLSWQQAFQGHITLRWAFGFVCVGFPLFRSTSPPSVGENLIDNISVCEHSVGKKKSPFSLRWGKALRTRMIKFITDFWHAIHKREIKLRVRIGLGDPADTGQLWAFIGPVSGMLANMKEVVVEIEPDFFDDSFELDSSGAIRVIPLQIIFLTAGFLLSPSVWQGLRQMRAREV